MDVIVAFVRAWFGRIVNSTLLRLAGNLQRAVVAGWARMASGLALSLVLCGTGQAGMEQVWQYKVSTLPGQTFSTLPQAEAAMRAVSNDAQMLKLSSEDVTAITISKYYDVPLGDPIISDWGYVNWYAP